MQLHGHSIRRKSIIGRVCNPNPSPETLRGIQLAIFRAESALQAGRLLTPGEAAAPAGPDARGKDTLYSIARDAAWETNGDLEDILYHLDERFPSMEK